MDTQSMIIYIFSLIVKSCKIATIVCFRILDILGKESDRLIETAFKNQQSNLQVEGKGIVIKLLTDDLEGSRHQRFILKLSSGHTLLIAHNIDVAPRINSLQEGDLVLFFGEYEWNYQGGIIHWTHHDPDGDHVGGWIKHKGQVYD